MSETEYRVATEVAYVATEDGPVRLSKGDPLPDNVSDDEVARLANGGVLQGFDVVHVEGQPSELELGSVDETKVRVGDDPEVARRYLELEQSREKPRVRLVEHLEAVIAASQDDGAV